MFNPAVAFPSADLIPGICFGRHKVSLPYGSSPFGEKFCRPFTSSLHAIEKDLAISSQAWKTNIPTQASGYRLSKNAEARPLLFANTYSPESNPFDVVKSSHVKASAKEDKPKRTRSNVARSHKLDGFQILRYLLSTESAVKEVSENNTLIFVVDERADKKDIKEAAKKLLNVRIRKVNTLISPGGTKKAFIMLSPDCKALDVAKKINIM